MVMSAKSNDDLVVEVNENFAADKNSTFLAGNTKVMVTPPLNENYWLLRVKVSDKQSVVAFPKFFTIGIGFQHEDEDWNTNLPWVLPSSEILNHIAVNKGRAPLHKCLQAIQLLKKKIKEMNLDPNNAARVKP